MLLQAIRTGKRAELRPDQPFILLTGHGDVEVVRSAKALDVSGYIVKPVAAETFTKGVNRALESKMTLRPVADYESVAIHGLARFQ